MKRLTIGRRSRIAPFVLVGCTLAATLVSAPSARAATSYYVSPDGTATADCTRATPCDLATGATSAQAGDYVILLDGTYTGQLTPVNSGTSSAWITFQADEGALPILNGPGGTTQAVGAGSDVSTYVRYVGLAVKNWSSGFSNKWIGVSGDYSANGHLQYINCIADGNSRNGMVFNSATGILMHQNIIAHNGTSADHSWSSGVQLYAVQGTQTDNVVEQCVSFENMDNEKHTDGSGFIVDTEVTGASFINNIAFLNGGSGLRLTKSKNIYIINNTFYHNGRDTADQGPGNPGEIYFTDGKSTTLTMVNNVGVASGTTQDPTSGWVWNGGSVTIPASNKTSGTFAGADGTNPDFRLTSGNALVDQGDSANAPATDNGFDPKCITKGKPTGIVAPSWSNYSIDYTYIKGLGGIGKCWMPGTRPAGTKVDIGAYEYNATVAPGTGGAPSPPSSGRGGSTGSGGATGTGGVTGTGGNASGGNSGGGGAGGSSSNNDAGAGSGGVASSGGAASRGGSSGNGGATTGGTTGGNSGGGGGGGGGGSSAKEAGTGGAASGGTAGNGGAASGGGSSGGATPSGGTASNGGTSSSAGSGGGPSGGTSGQSSASGKGGSSGSGGQSSQGAASTQQGCACQLGGQSSGSAVLFSVIAVLLAVRLRRRLRR